MLKPLGAATLVALTICGTTTLGAQRASPPSFDADVLTFYKSGDGRVVSTKGHIYRGSDGQTRQETGFGAVITDLKAKSVTLLNFDSKQAMVFDLRAVQDTPKPPHTGSSSAPIGHTTLEGHQVSKASGVTPKGERQEVWTADDIKAIVLTRIEAPGTTMTRYLRGISVREPDPALFTVPQGYTVTRQQLPPGFDAAKAIEFPGQGLGRGLQPGTGAGRGRGRGGW